MDIARQQGFQLPLGVPQQMPNNNILQHMFQAQQFQHNVMPPSGQGQSISSSFQNSSASGSASNDSSHISASAAPPSPSPQVCAPSISRRSTPLSIPSPPPPPKHSKGKDKVLAASQNSFKRKRSEPSDESSEEEEELFATPPPRHSTTNAPHVLSPRKLGEIFRSDLGESISFFVQVDLISRHGVVQNIKKNGGKMVGSINDADYVVLGNTMSKTFPDLIAQTIAASKLPLRSGFVADCVKHEALLDVNDYVLEEYVPPKKRGRSSVTTVVASKPRKEKVSKKVNKPIVPTRQDGPPSPTPPPVSARVELPGGNFRFSDEEIDFFRRYARHLLELDHTISNAAIFNRLHKKMPHHSSTSWQTYVRRSFPDELDTMRKKVGIARRKAADAGSQSQINQSENQGGPSKRANLSPPGAGHGKTGIETVHLDPREQDFQDICRFFATGGGENSDDEAVWASLASHQPARSAASWPEYYQSRYEEIIKEIERLVEEAVGGTSQDKVKTG